MIEMRELDTKNEPQHWIYCRNAFEKSSPIKVDSFTFLRLSAALDRGEIKGWKFADGFDFLGVALTAIRKDAIIGRRELIVYAAAASDSLDETKWRGCFEAIKAYALEHGCTHIGYYTIVPRLIRIGKLLGGDTDTHYISIPLGGENAEH